MQFFSMVWLMEVVCTAVDKTLYGNIGFICTILQKNCEWLILISHLLFLVCLKLLCSRQHSTAQHSTLSVLFTSVKKQHWPLDKFLFKCPNIQINLSQVLRFPPSFEWPTSSHPSDLSFSSETNVSTRHCDILWLFVQISSLTREGSRDEENLSHVQNESEF